MKQVLFAFIFLALLTPVYSFDLVIVKYKTGDWYNARQGAANFLVELKKRTTIEVNTTALELPLDDDSIFGHSFLFLNGHVPIVFSDKEKKNLRSYVLSGGFVFVNDDYGMDESFRKLTAEIFPEYPLTEIPFGHPVYHSFYSMEGGIPKIHEHDGGPPKAYGIFVEGRLALFYACNTDIADGWDYPEVHNDPLAKREEAFRMGVNIVIYSLSY